MKEFYRNVKYVYESFLEAESCIIFFEEQEHLFENLYIKFQNSWEKYMNNILFPRQKLYSEYN